MADLEGTVNLNDLTYVYSVNSECDEEPEAMLLLQSSSAAVEHVFSLLNDCFNDLH